MGPTASTALKLREPFHGRRVGRAAGDQKEYPGLPTPAANWAARKRFFPLPTNGWFWLKPVIPMPEFESAVGEKLPQRKPLYAHTHAGL
jgi:hypothetical protein